MNNTITELMRRAATELRIAAAFSYEANEREQGKHWLDTADALVAAILCGDLSEFRPCGGLEMVRGENKTQDSEEQNN